MKNYDITGTVAFKSACSPELIEACETAMEERFPEAMVVMDTAYEDDLWLQIYLAEASSPKEKLHTFFRCFARDHGLSLKNVDLDVATEEELNESASFLLEAVFPHTRAHALAPKLEQNLREYYLEHDPYVSSEEREEKPVVRVSLYAACETHERTHSNYVLEFQEIIDDTLSEIDETTEDDEHWMEFSALPAEDKEAPYLLNKDNFLQPGEEDIPVEEWVRELESQVDSLSKTKEIDSQALERAHELGYWCCMTAEEERLITLSVSNTSVRCQWQNGIYLDIHPGGEKATAIMADGTSHTFNHVAKEFMPFVFEHEIW